jgi:hypothetical protein
MVVWAECFEEHVDGNGGPGVLSATVHIEKDGRAIARRPDEIDNVQSETKTKPV